MLDENRSSAQMSSSGSAMIQELSELRFCIFDEPTYGVDAESREKLGDVMLEAQKAADLEQLILVSHDGAFDGKIEHSIFFA
jgi:DNA repair protein SbcC/Rad50